MPAFVELIRKNSQTFSLTEIVDGFKNGRFADMTQPVFKMTTIESTKSIKVEDDWCAFIQIRVTPIEY